VKFAANLSMLYPEHGFLDRFGAAAADGFRGVECVSPYEHPPELIADLLQSHGLEQAERIWSAVAHDNLRLQFDFFHIQMSHGATLEAFARLLPRIGHVQIADAPGRHEPGTGDMDYAAIFAALRKYDGWIGAEYIPSGPTSAGLGWRP
jgi:hydroxypyruvate isomerase